MPATQVIVFIIGSIIVICGAYFATYLVARGSQKIYRGRLIQVLDRFSLAKDKSLALIAVYDKIYLVAFTAGSVTLLDNIDPKTAAALTAQPPQLEDKLRQPESFITFLIAHLRRHLPNKVAKAKLDHAFSCEAYLPKNAEVISEADSFSGILRTRLEEERLCEEDNSQ